MSEEDQWTEIVETLAEVVKTDGLGAKAICIGMWDGDEHLVRSWVWRSPIEAFAFIGMLRALLTSVELETLDLLGEGDES